jgi:ATP-dependent RNA helicase HelY
MKRELDAVLGQIEGRTNQVAKTFDRICSMLIELGYVGDRDQELEVLESGKRLARIYGERDLLIAECLKSDTWINLDAPGLAAMAAALVYEARRDDDQFEPRVPKGNWAEIMNETQDIWWELEDRARQNRLPSTSSLDLSLSMPIYRWATGARLGDVLDAADLLAGDFIRWSKQIIDLLDQVAQVSDSKLAATAKDAMDRVKRGIVAYSYYQ